MFSFRISLLSPQDFLIVFLQSWKNKLQTHLFVTLNAFDCKIQTILILNLIGNLISPRHWSNSNYLFSDSCCPDFLPILIHESFNHLLIDGKISFLLKTVLILYSVHCHPSELWWETLNALRLDRWIDSCEILSVNICEAPRGFGIKDAWEMRRFLAMFQCINAKRRREGGKNQVK